MRKEALINGAIARLSGSIAVIAQSEVGNIFLITATDYSPSRAATIANSVSRSYLIFDLQRQLSELKLKYGEKYSTVMQLQKHIEKLEETLDGKLISDKDILLPASVKIIEQAIGAAETRSTNKPRVLVLSLVGGLMLGTVFSLLIGFFDERFASPLDLETFLKIPMLGSIPKGEKAINLLVNEIELSTKYTNAFHNIAERLYILINDKQLKSILITDIEFSEDIALISANLAALIGKKTDKSILIIDANLRTPGLMQDLNIPDSYGLAEVLEEKCDFEDVIYNISANISVVPSGNCNANPLALIASTNMSSLIEKVSGIYEVVFVVCAGLSDYQDAVVMSSILDGVVLVVDEDNDRKPVVRFAISPMMQRRVNLVGTILNNRSYVIPSIIYKLT
jgi:capsular exopolysaccharide synthesis family protein